MKMIPPGVSRSRATLALYLWMFAIAVFGLGPNLKAATVYVDSQIASTTCATYNSATRSCTGGSETAYRTIGAASTAAVPGTTILIRGGNYAEQLRPAASGTPGNPIIYEAYQAELVRIEASPGVDLSNRSHIILDKIRVEDRTWLEARNTHYCVLRNCVFLRTPASGTTGNIRFIQATYNSILNCIIEEGGDNVLLIDADYNLIQGNVIREGTHALFGIRCGDFNIIRSNYFANTLQKIGEVYDCGADTTAVPNSFNSTHNNVIEDNIFAEAVREGSDSTSNGNGIQYGGQFGIIRRNVFMNSTVGLGMQVYSDESLYNVTNRIYNNVFYSNRGPGVGTRGGVTNNHYFNNIFFENEGCINGCDVGTSAGQVVYRTSLGTATRFENNSFLYQTAGQGVIEEEFAGGENLTQAASSFPNTFFNSLEANPQFVNATSTNFSLQAGSPMIDAGAFLTRTVSAGSGTVIPVQDATFFHDGFGIAGVAGDRIQIQGQTQAVQIVQVNYTNKTLTVAQSVTWSASQGVALAFSGSAPDIGAVEFGSTSNPQPDTNAPTVSISAPTGGVVSGTVTVTANAQDNVAVAGVQFRVNGINLSAEDTASPFSVSWNTTLSSNGNFSLSAIARDSSGNSTTSATVNVTVSNVVDTTAPVISAISAAPTPNSVTITWTTSEASDSQVDYGTNASFGSSTTLNTNRVTNHSVQISGLLPGTLYHFRVRSRDSSSNLAVSAGTTFTTATNPPSNGLVLPIGIPNPGFGIVEHRPARPSPWNSEVTGYYYVDGVSGSDARTFGTPTAPRQTIPNPLPAGSYVEVRGRYSRTSGGVTPLRGNANGSNWVAGVSGPAWVVGDSNNIPTFDALIHIYGNYVYLDGIISTNEGMRVGALGLNFGADHIMIRNCEIVGDSLSRRIGIGMAATAQFRNTYILILSNNIHNFGDMNTTADQDASCTQLSAYTSYAWLLGNTLHTSTGPGCRVGAAQPGDGYENTHHIYVGFNHSYNHLAEGIWTKYCSDVVISQNTVHDLIPATGGPGIAIGGQYAPNGVWVIYNRIYNAPYGVRFVSSDDGPSFPYYIIGNIISDIHVASGPYDGTASSEAAIHVRGNRERYIINNTIYNSDAGINVSATAGICVVENNIVMNVTQPNGYHLNVSDLFSTVARNNLFFQAGSVPRISWGGDDYTVQQFMTDPDVGTGQGSLVGDPLFVSAANGNFRLQAASPAIGVGLALTSLTADVYQVFQNTFGVQIDRDYYVVPRPQGGTWDLGAVEYSTSVNRPSAPLNLRVIE